jgi:hypothetical protein
MERNATMHLELTWPSSRVAHTVQVGTPAL